MRGEIPHNGSPHFAPTISSLWHRAPGQGPGRLPRVAQSQLGMCSKRAISESHSCEEGEIRGGQSEGSTGYLLSTVFPPRTLPADPSLCKAVQERCIFFSGYRTRVTLFEVTLDGGEDTRMSWERDHQHHTPPSPRIGAAWHKSRKREEVLAAQKCRLRPSQPGRQPRACLNAESRPLSDLPSQDLPFNEIPGQSHLRQKGPESSSHWVVSGDSMHMWPSLCPWDERMSLDGPWERGADLPRAACGHTGALRGCAAGLASGFLTFAWF